MQFVDNVPLFMHTNFTKACLYQSFVSFYLKLYKFRSEITYLAMNKSHLLNTPMLILIYSDPRVDFEVSSSNIFEKSAVCLRVFEKCPSFLT